MPLRDHFHAPLKDRRHWERFHGSWLSEMVRQLSGRLPAGYFAEPQIHLGVQVDLPAQDVFEFRVYDESQGLRLVAAVELVSPRNKDRPESRRAFAIKCASYLSERVWVVLVAVVTNRLDDMYAEVVELFMQEREGTWPGDPPIYAGAMRMTKPKDRWALETWEEPLTLGLPLPTMPLWLADNLGVPLKLEATYEETCRVLRIG